MRSSYCSGSNMSFPFLLSSPVPGAVAAIGRSLTLLQQRYVPESRACVRIHRIHAVVFCGDEHHIVRAMARDWKLGHVQRLRVDFPVRLDNKKFSEAAR